MAWVFNPFTGTFDYSNNPSGAAVSSFSAGTTGLTPAVATSGAVTLGGTLAVSNGGTNATSFTANYVTYFDGTKLTGNSGLQYNGTILTLANSALIQTLTVGLGGGASSTNVAFGNVALASNTTGTFNVAIGSSALAANLVGNNNLAIGSAALSVNTGSTNTAIGTASLTANTTGVQNVGVGYATLATNSVGNNNTAVGTNALITCTGSGNAALGYNAGNKIAGGGNNTTVGNSAGYNITSGINNACLGQASGYGITTGSYNVIIGGYQGSAAPISATGSNYVVLSDGAANIGAYWQNGGGWYQQNNNASWSVTSDVSIKTNIIDLEGGLSVINALRAVEFDYIDSGRHDEGFIAQEYINVLPRQVAKKEDGKLAIQFNLLPYLVKAIQELSSENADLKQRLTALEGK